LGFAKWTGFEFEIDKYFISFDLVVGRSVYWCRLHNKIYLGNWSLGFGIYDLFGGSKFFNSALINRWFFAVIIEFKGLSDVASQGGFERHIPLDACRCYSLKL
jgi:hypothetical protein